MKLIDILLRELPKRGGWPSSPYTGDILEIPTICWSFKEGNYPSAHMNGEVITKEKYEEALSALQNPEWDGVGLPPVGCECEYKDTGTGKWVSVEIKYSSSQNVVFSGRIRFTESAVEISKDVVIDKPQFRPIRSESEKKRDEAISAMKKLWSEQCRSGRDHREFDEFTYDCIAAGKIPHIRID